MGHREDMSASDTKVPDMGQRRFENYQQTVPVQEDFDLPPSYEEASSSSQVARTHGTSHSGSGSQIRTPSSPYYSSRHNSLDADANDGLLRNYERSPQTHGQERRREEQGRSREEQQRRREEQSRRREEQQREREMQREEQRRDREEQQRNREEQRREREQQREEQQRDREEQQRNREEQRRYREESQHSRSHGRDSRENREHDADSDASSVKTTGYKATDPMHWEERTRRGDWESHSSEPGCCGSTTGGCCFSSRGGCCFSDRDGCCFSDRDACCFSDRGGCFFSDLDGGCFGSGGGCCFSHHSTEKDNHGVRL